MDNQGAVTYEQCPKGGGARCRCGKCTKCGWQKHMTIHGPLDGESAGSKPWGHEFVNEIMHLT